MTRSGLRVALALGVFGAALNLARAADPREDMYDLAAVEADHEVCGFALTDEQKDVIAQRRDALVQAGAVTADEIAATQDQLKAAALQQQPGGLCKPDGAEARFYKRRLGALGLL